MFNKAKEEDYFDLFITSADYACTMANDLLRLVNDFKDVEAKANAMHIVEHNADKHFHRLYRQLMRSFITPIERDDILLLAQKVDDVIDLIEDIAYKFIMFDIRVLRDDAIPFVELIAKSCTLMKAAMLEFKSFNKSKSLADKILQINDIEEEGDAYYKKTVRTLFASNHDAFEVIKWREVYATMESCLDACEDVADTMDGVILKNS